MCHRSWPCLRPRGPPPRLLSLPDARGTTPARPSRTSSREVLDPFDAPSPGNPPPGDPPTHRLAGALPGRLVAGFHTRFGPPSPFPTALTACSSPNPVACFSHSRPWGSCSLLPASLPVRLAALQRHASRHGGWALHPRAPGRRPPPDRSRGPTTVSPPLRSTNRPVRSRLSRTFPIPPRSPGRLRDPSSGERPDRLAPKDAPARSPPRRAATDPWVVSRSRVAPAVRSAPPAACYRCRGPAPTGNGPFRARLRSRPPPSRVRGRSRLPASRSPTPPAARGRTGGAGDALPATRTRFNL